jgi:general stress protein 26
MSSARARAALVFALCLPALSRAQTSAAPAAKIRSAALAIMNAARYCTLVTNGVDGQPQSRIVDPLIVSEGSVWIATNPLSRKVDEIKRDSRVTLTFFNTKANEFVTVIGKAILVTDSAQKARHWKNDWQPFYKQRTRGADFALFEIRASKLEVVSPTRGLVNDSKTWRPVTVSVP